MTATAAERCQAAFMELLCEHDYREVRMGEVARRAGVSRPTLYRCFSTKEELFRATVDALFEEFYDQAHHWLENFEDSLSLAVNYVASVVAHQHQELIEALLRSGADELFLAQMRRYFARLLGTLLRQTPVAGLRQADLEVVAALMAGACFQSLKAWVDNGKQQSPRQMAKILAHVFNARLIPLLEPEETGTGG